MIFGALADSLVSETENQSSISIPTKGKSGKDSLLLMNLGIMNCRMENVSEIPQRNLIFTILIQLRRTRISLLLNF